MIVGTFMKIAKEVEKEKSPWRHPQYNKSHQCLTYSEMESYVNGRIALSNEGKELVEKCPYCKLNMQVFIKEAMPFVAIKLFPQIEPQSAQPQVKTSPGHRKVQEHQIEPQYARQAAQAALPEISDLSVVDDISDLSVVDDIGNVTGKLYEETIQYKGTTEGQLKLVLELTLMHDAPEFDDYANKNLRITEIDGMREAIKDSWVRWQAENPSVCLGEGTLKDGRLKIELGDLTASFDWKEFVANLQEKWRKKEDTTNEPPSKAKVKQRDAKQAATDKGAEYRALQSWLPLQRFRRF